jgi:hypothetical protein
MMEAVRTSERFILLYVPSARNGNLEVPVYFLKTKQGYTVRKNGETKMVMQYILVSAGVKFRTKRKFRYGVLAHFESCIYPKANSILKRFDGT